MVNLVQKPNEWLVTYVVDKEVVHDRFTTIELAADFMVNKLRVPDDDIDDALCEMAAYNHTRALFSDNGYSHSEAT